MNCTVYREGTTHLKWLAKFCTGNFSLKNSYDQLNQLKLTAIKSRDYSSI